MKKYAYMKCLFSSMLIVFCVYGAAWFYDYYPIGRANAKTCVDDSPQTALEVTSAVSLEENAMVSESAAAAEQESQVTMESELQMTELSEETMPETIGESAAKPVIEASRELFDDALFIGDFRTVGLMEYGDLGKAEVFANTGLTVFEAPKASVKTSSGKKQTLQEVLQSQSFGKIYIMLGLNELGYPYDSIVKQYKKLVDEIHSAQPSAKIFLEANLHVSEKKSSSSDIYNNGKINQLNEAIRNIADESGMYYLDINPMFDDESGNLDRQYTSDDSHVLGKYYDGWTTWIMEETAELLSR